MPIREVVTTDEHMTQTVLKITTNIQGDFDNNTFAYNANYNQINLNILWLTIFKIMTHITLSKTRNLH